MFRKTYILPLMLLIGFSLCFINSFADEVDEKGEFVEDDFILEGVFEFPTAEGPAYIQGTPEFQRGPDRIIGTPDFEKMRDLPQQSQDYQLGTKVGWFYIQQRNNPNRGWICTGFLVGPDLFMTNHHCLHDELGLLSIAGARIYMDYYQDRDVDPSAGGITARVTEILRMDAPKDYALLRLDTAIGNTYGWLELDTTTRVNSTQSVKLISHPAGRSKEIVRRNSQIVDIPAGHPLLAEPFALAYLADSEGGSSGSPVFLRDGTGVIAIHHSAWTFRGVPQFNAGSLMSYIVPEIQQWLPGGGPPPPPPPSAGNLMYWVDWGTNKIQRANLNGTNVQDLVTGLRDPEGIALDVAGGKMYWTDNGTNKIQRSNLDGSHIEDLVTSGLTYPEDIALDVAGGKIYWTDAGTEKIQRANLNGTNVQDLITTGLNDPEGIALDLAGGKMYWTEYTSNKIRRANLDGSNVEDLITTGLRRPDPIALDLAGGKMYWGEYLSEKIRRANLDGSNIEDLITTGLSDPDGIALDVAGGKIYWTDNDTNKIQRANLNGSNIENLITRGLSNPDGIALGISPSTTPIRFNPSTIADQTFPVNTPIAPLALPVATGGTPPYTYTLSPIPDGLDFDAGARSLSGTPTTVGTTHVTYTATDTTSASDSLTFSITVTGTVPDPLDVNGDGRVDVLDLVLVAVFYGTRGTGLPADVNADGIVNVQDFAAVAAGVDAANAQPVEAIEQALLAAAAEAAALEAVAGAPTGFRDSARAVRSVKTAHRNIAEALVDTRHLAATDERLGEAVALLETLLFLLAEMRTIPETTALLPNYPNPFNPETWIPYHLATAANVTLTIYDVRGSRVRELTLGHQPAGVYESRGQAVYWDGKNQYGEKVASGLYFYTLTAGDFTVTRKMLIRK